MKKIIVGVLALVAVAASVQAATNFVDSFTRDNTANPDGGLGSDWNVDSGIFLNSGNAKTQTASDQFAIYNGAVTLTNAFELSLDMYGQAGGRYIGVVFHYLDEDNYYLLRTKFDGDEEDDVWQLLKVEYGSQSVAASGSFPAGSMPVNSEWRSMHLSETESGVYSFSISDPAETTNYVAAAFTNHNLSGGTSGFYFSGSYCWADNFDLTVQDGDWDITTVAVTDDFNRENTANPDGGLGDHWDTDYGIFLNSNVAKTQTGGEQLAIYNGAVSLTNAFDVSLDMYAQANGRYVGIVFHYMNSSNYYLLRNKFHNTEAGKWQFMKVENGASAEVLAWGDIATNSMPINTWRTMNLSETALGEYSFSITDLAGTTTNASGSFVDRTFTGGSAGFYFSHSFAWADNFDLTALTGAWPIPEQLEGEIVSIESYADGVLKLVVDCAGYPEVVYPKCQADMLYGEWTSVGHSIDGSAPFVVTNLSYSTTDSGNRVIYVEASDSTLFYTLGSE